MREHFIVDRERILSEIKRTAAENGGTPLGQDRFEAATGIRRYDWYGVHWARWGDAVSEAGFLPNTLQGAFDESRLFGQYAELTRSLGRIPTVGDLRLARRQNPTLAHQGTFERFGPKLELVQRMIAFCRENAAYGDLVPLFESYETPKPNLRDSNERDSGDIGSVYLIKSGRYYKVGRSNSAGRRQYELAIQLPDRATTVHVIQTDDPPGIEAYWHRRFESKRKNGEWFDLGPEDLAAFKRRKFM